MFIVQHNTKNGSLLNLFDGTEATILPSTNPFPFPPLPPSPPHPPSPAMAQVNSPLFLFSNSLSLFSEQYPPNTSSAVLQFSFPFHFHFSAIPLINSAFTASYHCQGFTNMIIIIAFLNRYRKKPRHFLQQHLRTEVSRKLRLRFCHSR